MPPMVSGSARADLSICRIPYELGSLHFVRRLAGCPCFYVGRFAPIEADPSTDRAGSYTDVVRVEQKLNEGRDEGLLRRIEGGG